MSRRASLAVAACALALAALVVASLVSVPYLPTNDGPEHVIAAHIENHYGDPDATYADYLTPATEFAARGFTLLYSPLEDLLGWRVALQVAISLIAVATAAGLSALIVALNPARWPLVFLAFPLSLTWELYMGFFPFTVGTAVGLFVITLAVRWREPRPLQRGLLALLLLLEAVCHVFTAALTGVVIASLMVARAFSRGRSRSAVVELGKVALLGAPAAAVLVASSIAGRTLRASPFADAFLQLPLAEIVAVFPRMVAPGPEWRALLVLLGLAIAIALGAMHARRSEADVTGRTLFVLGLLFLLGGALLPMNIPGWQFFSPRFIPLGVMLTVASAPLERLPATARTAAAPALFLLSAAWVGTSFSLHRRLAASSSDAIAGLFAPVVRHRLWLPITLAPEGGLSPYPELEEVPFLSPLRHLPMLYAVAEGGITPYTFANNGATYPFVGRVGQHNVPPIPEPSRYAPLIESEAFVTRPALRQRVLDELAMYAVRYEGVLVTGATPDDLAIVRGRGFVDDWSRGSVLVAHFVPCPLEVTLPADGEVPSVDLEAASQLFRYKPQPAPLGGDGRRHELLGDAPCGRLKVRPHWDVTKSDGTRASVTCKNAGADGALDVEVTRTRTSVACDP